MVLTLLGTGTSQGVPMIGCDCEVCSSSNSRDKRLRTSAMVEVQGRRIIIDAGPDFRYQMLRERVSYIDAVLLTHQHKDHIGGIDDLRAFNYLQGKPMEVYCSSQVAEIVRKDFDYAFVDPIERYAGVPELDLRVISSEGFCVAGVEVSPIEVMHHKLPIFGYKIGDLCYITDANYISSSTIEAIKHPKVLVINALRHTKHISHFTLSEALDMIEQISPQRAIITHISHQMGLYDVVSEDLPEGIKLGYDGMRINI